MTKEFSPFPHSVSVLAQSEPVQLPVKLAITSSTFTGNFSAREAQKLGQSLIDAANHIFDTRVRVDSLQPGDIFCLADQSQYRVLDAGHRRLTHTMEMDTYRLVFFNGDELVTKL